MTAAGFQMQPVSPEQGESGYFSSLAQTLDPRLFVNGGNDFRPEVRAWVLETLYKFWDQRYEQPRAWSTVWVAGSGISYQWAASRGNGDLDILIGVDFPAFFRYNPKYLGLSENDMATTFNEEFHQALWPQTAHTEINETGHPNEIGQKNVFEVTFYCNPGATDIRDIHPYAAYDLTHNQWTVHPPTAADTRHPRIFYQYATDEMNRANSLVESYNHAASALQSQTPGSPGYLNASRQADLLASQAQSLFDDIHLGRRQAFASGGSGYGDYYNFRWQFHKQHGTVQTLRAIGKYHEEMQAQQATSLYGGPVDAADVALRRAAMWNRGGNGR